MNESNPLIVKGNYMSRRRCSVPGCPSKYDMKLSFFKFPTVKKMNELWKLKCRIKESVKYNLIACEKHFQEKEYFAGNSVRFNVFVPSKFKKN
jgi:THAP domain